MKPYYDEGGITIYHGDCREVLPDLEPVDLILTSPPYNLGTSTGGGVRNVQGSRLWKAKELGAGYGTHDDGMGVVEYRKWQGDVLRECWARLSDSGAIYYNHKPRVQAGRLETPLDWNPGLPVRQIVVWARPGGVNFAPTHYLPSHEWIVIFARPSFRLSEGGWNASDVWTMTPSRDVGHPAPFPVALPTRVLNTAPGDVVLDPFMGSGTTLRAAKDLGRKAIGIEIEERYCEIAAQRLGQEVLDLAA